MKRALSLFVFVAVCAVASAVETFGLEGYLYYIPLYSNLVCGVVMGENGDYGNVRYEDVAWLKNAIAERHYSSLSGDPYVSATNYFAYERTIKPTPQMRMPFSEISGIDDLRFMHPSNALSPYTRLVTTNLVPKVPSHFATNDLVRVTNIVSRVLIGKDDPYNGFLNSYTNTYSYSTNVWLSYEDMPGSEKPWHPTNRVPDEADFCYADYRYDYQEETGTFREDNTIKDRFISRYVITNAFDRLKEFSNVSDAHELGFHASSFWEKQDYNYSFVNRIYSGAYYANQTSRSEENETNYVTAASNSLPGIYLYSSKVDSRTEDESYVKDDGEWKRHTDGTYVYMSRTSYETKAGECLLRVKTPISKDAYARLGGVIPIKKATLYALAELRYTRGTSGTWSDLSKTNTSSQSHVYCYDSVSTNYVVRRKVMIPLGETTEVFVPPQDNEEVCFELSVNGIQGKMHDALTDFANGLDVAGYKTMPDYMIPLGQGERVPMYTARDGDPSNELYQNYNSYNMYECDILRIYGVFFYEFRSVLPGWLKNW